MHLSIYLSIKQLILTLYVKIHNPTLAAEGGNHRKWLAEIPLLERLSLITSAHWDMANREPSQLSRIRLFSVIGNPLSADIGGSASHFLRSA